MTAWPCRQSPSPTYLEVNELDEFYALAVIFGVAYGGGMPLYASLARDYFGQRIMGTVFGAATMLSSLGMSIGPVAGGWVFDTYNNYAWLYIAPRQWRWARCCWPRRSPNQFQFAWRHDTNGSEGIARMEDSVAFVAAFC